MYWKPSRMKRVLVGVLFLFVLAMGCREDALAGRGKPAMAKKLELVQGKSRFLKIRGKGILSKSFQSSDKRVAAVTKRGRVIAKKVGKARITVVVILRRPEGQKKKKLYCSVTVNRQRKAFPSASSMPKPSPVSFPAQDGQPEKNMEPIAVPEEEKDGKDIVALSLLIQEQRAAGAVVSEDIDNGQYIWQKDESGKLRLRGIYWVGCRLSGTVDFSRLTALQRIDCKENYITEIDVSGCKLLEELDCRRNQIAGLDVAENVKLRQLYCGQNQIASLDVRQNAELRFLDCSENFAVRQLDVSRNREMLSLQCWGNRLSSLDISMNRKLKELVCDNNQISDLDVRRNQELTNLNCVENKLTDLDVSCNSKLQRLACSYNELTGIDLTKNPELEVFFCTGNKIRSLDVSTNLKLTALGCQMNLLTDLDVGKNRMLQRLLCFENNLEYLDISQNPDLGSLECDRITLHGIPQKCKIIWHDPRQFIF